MNILQNTVRESERREIFYDGIGHNINFFDRDLCSYIFYKSYPLWNTIDPRQTARLSEKFLVEKELLPAISTKDLCKKILAERFATENPLSKIIDSACMKNFASAFNLDEVDMKILFLVFFDQKNGWPLKNISSDYEKNMLICSIADIDIKNVIGRFAPDSANIREQIHLISSGVFARMWRLSKGADCYFRANLSRVLRKIDVDDSISWRAAENANKKQTEMFREILSKFRNNTDGCFMAMYGDEQDRMEKFISYLAQKNKFVAFRFEENRSLPNEVFAFLLAVVSAHIAKIDGIIVLAESQAEKVLNISDGDSVVNDNDDADKNSDTDKDFDPLRFLSTYNDENEQEKMNGTNCSSVKNFMIRNYLNYIQCPVVLLAKPFEKQVIADDDDDDDKKSGLIPELKMNFSEKAAKISLFNWQVKMPMQNNYTEYLSTYLRQFNLKENVIECAVRECSRLRIANKYWGTVANLLATFDSMNMSGETIAMALESMTEKSDGGMELRDASHYDLSVLKTSKPVDDLIECIQNAEKFQAQKLSVDSGIRILLYGISGTGKTAFVEHVARTIGRSVLQVRISDIERKWAGEAEQNIVTVFKSAVNTGAILLIDEADSLLSDRRQLEKSWQRGLVNEFIQQMERFPGILFCATNLADYLDSATNRRFHIQVKFEPLDKAGVEKLCSKYFSEVSFTETQIKKICNAGDVCPGDFGAVSGMLRFSDLAKVNAEYISDELIKTVKAKDKTERQRSIGF